MTNNSVTPTSKKPTSIRLTRALITIALFGAAGSLGGLLKIPSPVGSIGLDSAPGFFCAVFFGPVIGAVVGLVGHLGSAASAGFPLGGFLHANVAVHMAIWCAIFGLIVRSIDRQWSIVLAVVVGVALNSILSPLFLIPAGLPRDTAIAIMPFLAVAAALNLILAAIAIKLTAKLTSHDI